MGSDNFAYAGACIVITPRDDDPARSDEALG